jgi:glycosyltransferase involved in cell wall biosynthesis
VSEIMTTKPPSILFLSEAAREDQGSRLVRCAYQAKQLIQGGLNADVVYYQDARAAQLDAADVWIFSRCRFDDTALKLVAHGRKKHKLLCGDLDDRIFAPWDVDNTGYMRSRARPKSTVSARQSAIERDVLRLLPAFELVTVSTPGLAEELAKIGVSAHVARNAFDSERHPLVKRPRVGLSRILVMSGTPTHDQDLRRIAPALARFLAENPDVDCTLLGSLQMAGPLRGLANVASRDLLPVAKLYGFVAEFDLCLVPLEDTLFNDCKSALKFVECGAVSVPVLASPRREYRGLVRQDDNGFLSDDSEEGWYRALCRLKAQPELIQRAAHGAYESVLHEHTVKSRGSELADFWRAFYLKQRAAAHPRSTSNGDMTA